MEAYLHKSIKEVINQFPEVERILDEYQIGCGPCTVGSCLLKDVIEIHRLPANERQEMMARIAEVISSGMRTESPSLKRKPEVKPRELKYSPPLKQLVDEHVLIKRWVALIPTVIENLDVESEEGRQLVLDGLDFIRSYADRYHHAKEEDILFKYFDRDLDILKVMHEDHRKARSHVKAILTALEGKDENAIAAHLNAYRELLTEHIKKEDEILYPWMDSNLSTAQVGELFSRFNEAAAEIGDSAEKYEALIDRIERKFQPTEA